jgi:hypothetical protein
VKGIPPELDRLMWAVAEDGGDQAIHEFVGRYPQHRGELMHRVNMVAGLRNQVRQPSQPYRQIPRFEPREPVQTLNPRAVFFVGVLGLAAIAAASYTAVFALKPVSHPQPPPVIPVVNLNPIKAPEPVFTSRPAPTQPQDEVSETTPEPPRPGYLRPEARIAFKSESLASALQLVTAGSGMKVEIGPGFVDQEISGDYRDMSPLDALQDMAKKYAFTVFDEGNGRFLVLPVADSAPSAPPAGSHAVKRIGP